MAVPPAHDGIPLRWRNGRGGSVPGPRAVGETRWAT